MLQLDSVMDSKTPKDKRVGGFLSFFFFSKPLLNYPLEVLNFFQLLVRKIGSAESSDDY